VHDLHPGESAQFEGEDGKLVAIVIRDACKDRRVVQFVDHSVGQTVSTRRNARVSTLLVIFIYIMQLNKNISMAEGRPWPNFADGPICWIAKSAKAWIGAQH
jgi:hypothetical protein